MLEMLNLSGKKPEARGEFRNSSPNTSTTLTIPANVSKINGVLIGSGGSGGAAGGGGGGGGGLLYFNRLPVKQGDKFQVSVGPNALYSYGDGNDGGVVTVTLNGVVIATISGGVGGKRSTGAGGAAGVVTVPANSPLRGVGVVYWIGPGTPGGVGVPASKAGLAGSAGSYTGTANDGGQSPYGQGAGEKTFGGGSRGGNPGDSSPTCASGAVRLVWGDNREYPYDSRGNV